MPRTLFSADLHIGHTRIIEYCNRPFSSVEEMNEALVANWNATVTPEDSIYVLGDFANRDEHHFHRLNGRKFLIIGNHDRKPTLKLPWAETPQIYKEITVDEDGEQTRFVLMHYSIRSWNNMYRGVLHLYGHTHSRLPDSNRCLDVGVDCWDYRPVSVAQIKQRMATLPEWKPEIHRSI